MPPSPSHGKICYVELPATDIASSAHFYRDVFGWKLRTRGDGYTAFDDATGQVSGTWVSGHPAGDQPGLMLYVMVDDAAATLETIARHGGAVTQPIGADAPEITARFRDPGGNVIGLYQQPGGAVTLAAMTSHLAAQRLAEGSPEGDDLAFDVIGEIAGSTLIYRWVEVAKAAHRDRKPGGRVHGRTRVRGKGGSNF